MVKFIFGLFLVCMAFTASANPVIILNNQTEEILRNEEIQSNLNNVNFVLDNNISTITLIGGYTDILNFGTVNIEITYIISNDYIKKYDILAFRKIEFAKIKEYNRKFTSVELLADHIAQESLKIEEVKSVIIRIIINSGSYKTILNFKKSKING